LKKKLKRFLQYRPSQKLQINMAELKKQSKSPVIRCAWCDDVLKGGISQGNKHFCDKDCKAIYLKKEKTPTQYNLETLKANLADLRSGKNDATLKQIAKSNYLHEKKMIDYLSKQAETIGTTAKNNQKPCVYKTKMFGYLYNGDKEKFMETFEKYKSFYQTAMDATLFDGAEYVYNIVNPQTGEYELLKGEEGFRINCMVIKLDIEYFKLYGECVFK
jgi:hypothetical protein